MVVLGASGHAKVSIELLRAAGLAVDYCIGASGDAARCLDVPVLHGDEHLTRLRDKGYQKAFIAIGANALRQHLATGVTKLGFRLVNAVSPHAVIAPTARIGAGVAVMAGAVINADSVIGDLAIVNTLASVDHDGVIGEAVHIAPHTGLAGNVTIGARSFLGIGCKVIPQITIGNDVIAAAGSVIVTNIDSNSRIAGVPAKAMRKRT